MWRDMIAHILKEDEFEKKMQGTAVEHHPVKSVEADIHNLKIQSRFLLSYLLKVLYFFPYL